MSAKRESRPADIIKSQIGLQYYSQRKVNHSLKFSLAEQHNIASWLCTGVSVNTVTGKFPHYIFSWCDSASSFHYTEVLASSYKAYSCLPCPSLEVAVWGVQQGQSVRFLLRWHNSTISIVCRVGKDTSGLIEPPPPGAKNKCLIQNNWDTPKSEMLHFWRQQF